MSPELGYFGFTQSPIFGTDPVLDGVQMTGVPRPLEKKPSRGANVLEHASGDVTLQLAFRDSLDPEGLGLYSWAFTAQARDEAGWWLLERIWKRHSRVWFVPWDQEEEIFTAGVTLDSFRLPRPDAASVLNHPDIPSYPTRAWLDDVAQTVIATGTPGATQVKVAGRTVTTPTLTAGQVLRIRYCPAYRVAITQYGPQQLVEANELTKAIVLTEIRDSV